MPNPNAGPAEREPLRLKFLGALVEQLGEKMYPSATASIAELISNAWDADAQNLWVTVPFGQSWTEADEIVVLDDGHGMTREQAQQQYLEVGRKRRTYDGGKSEGNRSVHGRKGLGKLAAFGTAKVLDCYTVRAGQITSFRLDYDAIRSHGSGADCPVSEDIDQEPLQSPDGTPILKGTRIRLSNLRLKRAIPESQFMQSMSRRFSIDQTVMRVFINGQQLQRFDIPLEFKYPRDAVPNDSVIVDSHGWGTEKLSNGEQVRWWIGFTEKPLQADYLKGISILARDKMVQRPFMFERARGAEGQLGQEYLVGEVEANWLDTGVDIEDDLVQANRDQLQLEDDRVRDLLSWGRRRLDWALSQRLGGRREKAEKSIETPDIMDLIKDFTQTEQRVLGDIAKQAAKIGDPDPKQVHDFMVEVVNGYKDKAVRELIERVQVEDEGFQSSFWGLVREFSLIDARKNLSIIQARLETIERLDTAIKAGATEVPEIHEVVKQFPWLLDPRWSLLGDEVDPSTFREGYEHTIDEETGDRLDFLFILQPGAPASADQLLVVEIKRGYKSNGKMHSVRDNEVHKLHRYVLGVREHYASANTAVPIVHGLMIANSYTETANRVRMSLENLQDVRLEFRTWDAVIENTRALHTSWLEVTRRAAS